MRYMNLVILALFSALIGLINPQVSDASRVDCTRSEAKLIRANANDSLEYQGIILYSGSIEGKNHYDALVVAYIGDNLHWCRRYETDDDTSTHAEQLDGWGGRIFVTITTDGGTGELDTYTVAGWQPTYGLGRGPQAATILEIDPTQSGEVMNGTYVISKTEDGLTNTVIIYGVQFHDMRVYIDGVASSYVLDLEGNPLYYVDCPRGSAFQYVLDYDMTQLLEVICNGVTARSNAVLRNNGELPENLPESINPGGGFFSYCTDSRGILVMRTEGGMGYEIFAVPAETIGNGLQQAVATGQNVKLGEGDNISIWALSTDELQFSTPDPYTFIVSKYICGDPIVTGEAITLATSANSQAGEFIIQSAQAQPKPTEPSSSLPVYRPSPLKLNDDGTYTIRAGDNLNTIASKLGINVDVLAEYNDISDKRFIQIGQILQIPDLEN